MYELSLFVPWFLFHFAIFCFVLFCFLFCSVLFAFSLICCLLCFVSVYFLFCLCFVLICFVLICIYCKSQILVNVQPGPAGTPWGSSSCPLDHIPKNLKKEKSVGAPPPPPPPPLIRVFSGLARLSNLAADP